MKLEDIETLSIDLTNHINLLEHLAYEMDEGREDVKVFAHILWLSSSSLTKISEKIKSYLKGEWEWQAQMRLAKIEGRPFIHEVNYDDLKDIEATKFLDLVFEKSTVYVKDERSGFNVFRGNRFNAILESLIKTQIDINNETP